MSTTKKTLSRRDFIRTAGIATAGLMVAGTGGVAAMGTASPLTEAQRRNVRGANYKVNLAGIGIGYRGRDIITAMDNTGLVNVVALCDVDLDSEESQKILSKFPKAKRYRDFRRMFDEMAGEIDAVTVGTPDHSHFPISMLAMSLGKHVYVEKPMARTFQEAELMMAAANKYPSVVTQVGNQGHSEANYFQFKSWVEAGIIKDVTKVTAHMNSARRWHSWDTDIRKYPEAEPLPLGMDWDTWLMAARYHDFNTKYHPGDWRSWYDFGMGALGDWGAHIIDTIHEFLDLGLPYEVDPLLLEGHNDYFFPKSSTILFRFPSRGTMPALDLTWYDGVDNLPPLPQGYGVSELDPNIPPSGANVAQPVVLNPGKIIYGGDLTFKGGSHGTTLSIIPEEKAREMEHLLPEVPESTSNHYENFIKACLGEEQTRSPFQIHGPLSQVFSLGVIAQQLGEKLIFDRRTMQITNNRFANALLAGTPPRKGWEEFYKL
ncbi:MAG: Gfo/Idh/MocA family oxidoreductase [Rikenellaceae bacterium]|nr:Gfo/Idh/MocA family oxidoreductase [Rikenellaceae bacterium]